MMQKFAVRFFVGLVTFFIGCFSSFHPAAGPELDIAHLETGIPPVENYDYRAYYDFFAPLNSPQAKSKNYEKKVPFCDDKKILSVWKLLVKDSEFRERTGYSDDSANCTNMLEIRLLDLNGDGQKEIMIRGANCGGVGNCGFWIFQKQGATYKKLLSSSDYIDATKMGGQVKKSRTKGYHDILLKGHMNASDTTYTTYKFNGRRYSQARSLINANIPGTSPKPKWKFVTYDEYDKMHPGYFTGP
jgi:hypothetical protein